jgi:hypothetical protein
MKSEDDKTEGKPVDQPAEAAKPGKPVKQKKEKKQSGGARLPFLLEFTYTIATLILIFLAFAIIINSFLAGASLFTVILRTTAAVVVIGSLLMLILSQISSGLLFAVKIEQEEAEKKLEEELNEKQEEKSLHSIFDEGQNKAEAL